MYVNEGSILDCWYQAYFSTLVSIV